MVEGPTLAAIHDKPQGCVQISQDIARGNSQRFESKLSQCAITLFIASRPIGHGMHFTIDFDCQAPVKTCEIEDIAADWELPSEPQAARSTSKLSPQQHLGQRHLAAKLASKLHIVSGRSDRPVTDSRGIGPSTALCAVPLPVPGRI